jgi:hypothetical protein
MAENLTLIDTDNIPTKASGLWTSLAVSAVEQCSRIKKEREKEILFDRFGVGKNAKTLHAIGQKYGVTRERIRQIVNNAVKKIQKYSSAEEVKSRILNIEEIVSENGGFATKDYIFNVLGVEDKIEQNSVRFIASLSNKLDAVKESNVFKQGWSLKAVKFSKIKNIARDGTAVLREVGKTISTNDLAKRINESNPGLVGAALSGVKAVMKTDNDKWGLISWPHVNPRSIRDKSKYIMLRHGKPLHYSELTIKIGDMGIKNVTKQSVHNELIKNQDFVLVGRGIYALTEWGYEPGVVEEVIASVLTDAGRPLHKDDIIDRVLTKRIVKASTVILNLQKPRFKRVGKAVYTIN